jgi:hypothetical protein
MLEIFFLKYETVLYVFAIELIQLASDLIPLWYHHLYQGCLYDKPHSVHIVHYG